MRLLVTRPEPDATRSADALRARGHQVLVAPLLQTQAIAENLGGPFAAVLMTSANAARAIAAHPRATELTRLAALTVGVRSAEAARSAGFIDVVSADGALAIWCGSRRKRFPGGRLLYLAGEDRAGDLPAICPAWHRGRDGGDLSGGRARNAPGEIVDAIDRLDGVLHYSRRSAETLLRLASARAARACARPRPLLSVR